MSAEKTFNSLPPWAKGLIAVVGTAVVVWGGYEVYIYLQAAAKRKSDKAEEGAITAELSTLNADPSKKQTISDTQADSMANSLFASMDGYGHDTLVIIKVMMQLVNQADWLALNKAYGVRTLSSGKYNPTPDFKGTLTASLQNEFGVLDQLTLPDLNKRFKERGINAVL